MSSLFVCQNMVRAPAGALYCLRFSKCISSHLIHKIVENAWFWTLIIKNCWPAHVQKRGTARSKWVLSSEFIVFSHVFADPVGNRLNFIFFVLTFHAVCLCRAYPGSWKRGPHWSDATVHAIGISTMRFLWFSLWIAGYMLRQRTWRYHTHPTPPQPHPTCRRVSNVASVAVHVCRKCTWT